jgi:hypothetical protein
VGKACCTPPAGLTVSQADYAVECGAGHVVAEMACQSSPPNSAVNGVVVVVDRTNRVGEETTVTRTGPRDSEAVDSHKTYYRFHRGLLGSVHANDRHWQRGLLVNCVGRATALGNRSRETGDREGRWEWTATACFAALQDAGSEHAGCSAARHTERRVEEETAAVPVARVCGCWTR